MSSIGMRAAIAHAAVNGSFRQNVLSNPSTACAAAGYQLSSDELSSLREVIADDAFGASFSAGANLPELFQETSSLVDTIAPLDNEPEETRAV